MYRTLLMAFALMLLLPLLVFAQDGKLRGVVSDRESGEPLIGANVVLEGTNLGASTDINGEYIILSVPPGAYTVRASYIGYAPISVSNVRVSANLTTTQNLQLASTAIQTGEVLVVADRPLIQRNTTNTVRMQTQEDIKNLPIRGFQNLLALNAGVVQQNGNLYVRGGRAGEVAYFLDGANTTNPINNTQSIGVIQEAIEEIQLQAGGYTAEFGGSNSGIVRTTLRSGTSDYRASVDYRTDDFAKPGSSFFGGSSFGYRNAVLTLSGPIMSKDLRFFVAGQHNYIRDRNVRWVVPFRFDGLRVDVNDARWDNTKPANQQALLPGTVEFKENYIPNSYDLTNSAQGTVIYDMQPFKFRFTGTYSDRELPLGKTWPGALAQTFRVRQALQEQQRGFGELKMTHVLGEKSFYEVGVSYQSIASRNYDPKIEDASGPGALALTVGGQSFTPNFYDNWHWYSDSLVSEQLGLPGFRRRYAGPFAWSTISGFSFSDPSAPINNYNRNSQSAWGFHVDFTSQVSSKYELKAGGRLDAWTARNYTVNNISGAMEFLYGLQGKSPRTFTSMDNLAVELSKTQTGYINYYGYDVFGNEVDSGVDGPREPLFASAYVQNKFEYEDLVLNLGVRFEHFDTKAKVFADPNNPGAAFNEALDVIDQTLLVDADPFSLLLPRVSFSFPVTDRTVFYAQYGKYAQMPSLNQLYVGNTVLSRTVSPVSRGNAFLQPVGYLMKPERTTQYEMGFRQTLTDNFAFTMSGFYKDLKDQLAVRFYVDPTGQKLFTAYLNEDFGTVKGVELTLELRRTNRFAARINYTMSDAQGTGSNSQSAFGAIEQNIGTPTNFINPLDFNQTHVGTLYLDYRFDRGDGGPILEGFGINALISFNSGHNYTKIREPRELGQASAWNVGIRPLIDPRSSFPAEPINASSTPWVFNIDLNVGKTVWIGGVTAELYVNVLNLLNTKHVLNVYPSTGTPYDDGWLTSAFAAGFHSIPNYADFYRAINLDNQWAYQLATGNEMFGTPRQIRVGLRLDI
jgi:outer membrane receptor protein involved in Fe transport